METREIELDRNGPFDNIEPEQNNNLQSDVPEEQNRTVEPKNRMNITDLADNCLEYIFKKLNFDDLLNVADSSKCFGQAVNAAYSTNFKTMEIELFQSTTYELHRISTLKDRILFYDLSTCLKVLRCFGHLISRMYLQYPKEKRHQDEVDRYLNEYCKDSLRSLEMYYASQWTSETIKQPFSKLHSIICWQCNLSGNFGDFNKWFPQLRSFELVDFNIFQNPKCIEDNFPHLHELMIQVHKSFENPLGKSNIASALLLNPQIIYLKIDSDFLDAEFLHSINEHLQSIECLHVVWHPECFNHDGPIHFSNVTSLCFEIYDDSNEVEAGPMPKIPFTFDRLEKFELDPYIFHLTDDVFDFIRTQTFLTHLTLLRERAKTNLFQDEEDKLKLAKAARSLQEIELESSEFAMDEIVDFVRNCGSMKQISFRIEDLAIGKRLRNYISYNWRISYGKDHFELQRQIS